jgi:quercetin dioxygenase-like cupin family protein
MHPGPSFVTLLYGDMVLCIGGVAQRFRTGDTWIEPAGTPHSGINGVEQARIASTSLLPEGANLTRLAVRCTDPGFTAGASAP